jgi:hypothetical protein
MKARFFIVTTIVLCLALVDFAAPPEAAAPPDAEEFGEAPAALELEELLELLDDDELEPQPASTRRTTGRAKKLARFMGPSLPLS